MNDVVIEAEGLGKRYRIGARRKANQTFREFLTAVAGAPFRRFQRIGKADRPEETIWALKDVSFEVRRGEIVGIIGKNGAGKSTLLKILSRITEPTEGRAELRGRVGSLLEIGTGFHPELTGRENIYLNGAILGMKKADIIQRFDEIVTFSGIEKFMDTPVKRYSSGMYVRLAFSVAAHLEPDILLVDEVLAVGDTAFQKKCLGKMDEVSRAGRTVLFVSHNMGVVQSLCPCAILIRHGRVALKGETDEVVREYLAFLSGSTEQEFGDHPDRTGNGWIRLTSARVLDASDRPSQHLVAGEPASFELTYENAAGASQASVILTVFNHLGVPITTFDMRLTDYMVGRLSRRGKFVCSVPNLPLPIGQYRVAAAVVVRGQISDMIPNALLFDVLSSKFFRGSKVLKSSGAACLVQHVWRHEAGEANS